MWIKVWISPRQSRPALSGSRR